MVNTEQGPTTMVNLIYIPVHSNISVCILPVQLITTKATFIYRTKLRFTLSQVFYTIKFLTSMKSANVYIYCHMVEYIKCQYLPYITFKLKVTVVNSTHRMV